MASAIARALAHAGWSEQASTTYLTSIASRAPLESEFNELSWLLERAGDPRMAAVMAGEGLA